MKERKKIYWGWYVVFGGFLLLCVTYGTRYSFGVFVKPMFNEYNWPMSIISLGASINILMYALGGIVSGKLVDKMAPKWIIIIGGFTASLGFILTSVATSPIIFFLSYGILCGLGSSCMGVVVTSSSVGKWFIKKKGVSIGIAAMGVSLGTVIFTPIAGYVVKNYHWSKGFILFGLVICITSVLISSIFMKHSVPEDCGLLPDGEEQGIRGGDNTISINEKSNVFLSEVLRQPVFWIISFCFSAGGAAELMVFVHVVSFSVNNNIDKIAAASSLGIIGLSSFCGRFLFGWLCDRLSDPKYAASLGSLFMAGGMSLLLFLDLSIGVLYAFAVIFGIGYASTSVLLPVMASDRFGRNILGSTYGLLTFFVAGIGGSLGPVLGGLIYDRFSSYDHAWGLNLFMLIFVSILILFLKPKSKQING